MKISTFSSAKPSPTPRPPLISFTELCQEFNVEQRTLKAYFGAVGSNAPVPHFKHFSNCYYVKKDAIAWVKKTLEAKKKILNEKTK